MTAVRRVCYDAQSIVVVEVTVMIRPLSHLRQGFTLIEMVIVLAIFTILSTVGFGLMRDGLPRYRTKKAAMEFSTAVSRCRAMAVETGRECRVLLWDFDPNIYDEATDNVGAYSVQLGNKDRYSTSWDTLPEDADADGTDDSAGEGRVVLSRNGEDEMRWVSLADWTGGGSHPMTGPGTGNADSLVFGPRGFLTNPNDDFDSDGYITVRFVNKFAWAVRNLPEAWDVRVARSGMSRLDPTLSNVWEGTGPAGTTASSGVGP